MSSKDEYVLGYSQQFNITGREEKTEDLNLTINPIANSGNLTGTVTSGGSPVAGATIKVFDTNNNPIEHTTTGGNGQFTITNLPAGSYQVLATKDGYLIPTSTPVTIQSNKSTTVNLIIQPDPSANLGAVFGIIRDNNTLLPIENAIVDLYSTVQGQPPTFIGIAPSNANGQYLFTELIAGNYYVSASKLGYQPKDSAPISVGTKEYVLSDVNLTADPQSNTGTVSGFIKNQTSGQPIPNAVVALYSISGGVETVIALTKTSSSGRYLFGSLNQGTYRVKATLQDQVV